MRKWKHTTIAQIVAISVEIILFASACTIVAVNDRRVFVLQIPWNTHSIAVTSTSVDWLDPTPSHDALTPTQESDFMPTPEPEPELRPMWFIVSATVSLNVRSGPGVKHDVVERLAPGTLVQVRFDTDSFESGSDRAWAYVHSEKGKVLGWVALDYLEDYPA